MQKFIQVMTTVEQRSDAERIAKTLLEKRLAACVQVAGPVRSYFHWEGKVNSAEEYLCFIKSRADLFPELEATIEDMHPYNVPEIISIPVTEGGSNYLNWLASELKP